MKNKINLTVIIPVHSCEGEKFDEFFKNAIASINGNDVLPEEVLIVVPDDKLIEHLETFDYADLNVHFWPHHNSSDFQTQMNEAVKSVTTPYFSFLEFDDEYSNLWFRNVQKYINEYPEVAVFLPIISDITAQGKYIGYTNEVAWAYEFTDKHGFVDADVLKEYPNFNPDGMVMKTEEFKRIGGYKKNIRLTFNLEFLLRICDQALQVMVIPKIGYQHMNMRPNSLFWNYKHADDNISPAESVFWMETARKEFYYIDDREVTYVPEPITEPIEKV